MTQSLESWTERLDQTCLPALPRSVPVLLELLADKNVRFEWLSETFDGDPGLTLHLLRAVNTLSHRHLSAEVTTITHALMMLGLERIGPVVRSIPAMPGSLTPGLLKSYSRAFHAAFQAWDWARLRQDMVPDEVLTATLLHNLAEMLLWIDAPDRMQEVASHTGPGMDPEEAECVVLGFGLDQLTLQLADRWNLPSLLQLSLHPEAAENPRVRGIMLAVRLAREAELGWYRPKVHELIGQIAEHLDGEEAETANRVHRNAAIAARRSAHYGTFHPAALLLDPLQKTAFEQKLTEEADFCLTPRTDLFQEILRTLRSPQPRPLRRVVELALNGMHQGIGLNRVAFAALAPDRTTLRPVAIVGPEQDTQFGCFSITIDDETNLFARLLARPHSLWLNEDNRDDLWPLVPHSFRRTVRSDSFFVGSVFVRNKPLGVFYADRRSSTCSLDQAAYEQFKLLAATAAEAIGKSGGQ